MNKDIQWFLLFNKLKILTKLPEKEISKRLNKFISINHGCYKGRVSSTDFYITEHNIKGSPGGHSHNSFAPTADGVLTKENGMTSVLVTLKMNPFVFVFFAHVYYLSMLLILPFPIMYSIAYFGYIKPAKKLKNALEDLFTEEDFESEY